MRACPACGGAWSEDHEVCPHCLAALVADLDATIACPQCGHVCPTRMQTCPSCFALLRAEDIDPSAAISLSRSLGVPMGRPEGRAAFASGPGCTLKRLSGRSMLVLLGVDGFVEATVPDSAESMSLPMECVDDDRLLFRLEPYEAVAESVVATDAVGVPIATYLAGGGGLDVRDETSAPVARLTRDFDRGGFRLVETGGRVLAQADVADVEQGGWLDDQWTITPHPGVQPPLQDLALVALAVAAKLLLGHRTPTQAVDPDSGPDGDTDGRI
jgi:RNA polymerase subunit RPABC4/transcription elongation factor Spt4